MRPLFAPVVLALLLPFVVEGSTTAHANDLALDREGNFLPLDQTNGYARPRQIYVLRDGTPITIENPDASQSPRYVTTDLYPEGGSDVVVRIANGGAGAAGLFEALAYAYLEELAASGEHTDFAIAWYLTDTTYSLEALAAQVVDIAVTYSKPLEEKAVERGEATERRFAFMDHFMLVGPIGDSAGIEQSDDTHEAFAAIIDSGCTSAFAGQGLDGCAHFLSRDDDSATQIKERAIFDHVMNMMERFAPLRGQKYTDESVAPRYFKCPPTPVACFPAEALNRADDAKLYTLTDWGTWLANGGAQGAFPQLDIFVTGRKENGRPVLLNPAAALLSPSATPEAQAFYTWMLADDGGQEIIRTFGADMFGEPFYVPAADTSEPQ